MTLLDKNSKTDQINFGTYITPVYYVENINKCIHHHHMLSPLDSF